MSDIDKEKYTTDDAPPHFYVGNGSEGWAEGANYVYEILQAQILSLQLAIKAKDEALQVISNLSDRNSAIDKISLEAQQSNQSSADKVDAERYRWLRVADNPQMDLITHSYGDELDEAIDAAIAKGE